MTYNLHLPGDFLAMDLTSDDKKWQEVVSCARGGMNTHVEDEIEGCDYTFGNMSGNSTVPNGDSEWQPTKQKKLQLCVKSRKLARSYNLNLKGIVCIG